MNKVDLAVACFQKGFNCSQAVLSTYCDKYGQDEQSALKLACGLGGGMGRLEKTCGVVTGAYLDWTGLWESSGGEYRSAGKNIRIGTGV